MAGEMKIDLKIQALLPSEGVMGEDFELPLCSPAGRELVGAQGGTPPRAGHHEAVVLSSARRPKNLVASGTPGFSFGQRGQGTGASRKPGNGSGTPGFPADAVQP